MSIVLVQSTSKEAGTVTSTTLAFGSNVAAGSRKTCLIRTGTSVLTNSASDSLDGAYTQDVATNGAGTTNVFASINSFKNATAGATTVTATQSGSANLRLVIQEVSGLDTTSQVDVTAGAIGSSTTPDSGPVTTTTANEFLCGFICGNNGVAFAISAGSGWTQDQQLTASADRLLSEYQIVSATGTYNATATIGASDPWTATIATYKGASTAAAAAIWTPRPLIPIARAPYRRFRIPPLQPGALVGSGALAGQADLLFGQTGALTGTGALAGTSALTFNQTGALTGAGALAGSSALVLGQTGALTGTGALAGSSTLTFGQAGALAATGSLAGSSALTFGQTGLLAGAGALSGSSALTLGQTGALSGVGALAGLSALTFGASATADVPSGAISGTTAVTLGASGTLSASGTLAGIAAMLFDAFGTLDQPSTVITQPGPVDSPRIAEGFHRRKKRKQLKLVESAEPVFISPASFEHAPPQAVIDRVPDFTALAQSLGETQAALSAKIDHEIELLMREAQERDDEEALVLILTALE